MAPDYRPQRAARGPGGHGGGRGCARLRGGGGVHSRLPRGRPGPRLAAAPGAAGPLAGRGGGGRRGGGRGGRAGLRGGDGGGAAGRVQVGAGRAARGAPLRARGPAGAARRRAGRGPRAAASRCSGRGAAGTTGSHPRGFGTKGRASLGACTAPGQGQWVLPLRCCTTSSQARGYPGKSTSEQSFPACPAWVFSLTAKYEAEKENVLFLQGVVPLVEEALCYGLELMNKQLST